MDSSLKFTTLEPYRRSVDSGIGAKYYYDGDSAKSYTGLDEDGESWMQAIVDSDTSETLKFWWKADFELNTDYLGTPLIFDICFWIYFTQRHL